ncbi:Hypothetical predicted protein, partial [Paramuricea clavata]
MRLKNGKNQEYHTIRKQGAVKRCVLQQPDESEHANWAMGTWFEWAVERSVKAGNIGCAEKY